MPNLDRTGPNGQGAMTGLKRGYRNPSGQGVSSRPTSRPTRRRNYGDVPPVMKFIGITALAAGVYVFLKDRFGM